MKQISAGKSLILIVDDSAYARETLASSLTLPDYELVFAANGQEAIQLAERLTPDLILLDVMMPGMNGFQVCQSLRAHPRLSEVPIILVTALDDRESRLYGLDAGADDFVTKPIDRAELRVRVRTVTRLNRYRRLLNQQLRFEWVVNQADEGYLLIGPQGALRYANPSARMFLELPDDARLSSELRLHDLVRRLFRCEPEEAWIRWFDDGMVPDHCLFLIRPETESAAVLWLEVTILAQFDRAGVEQLVRVREVTTRIATQRDIWTFQAMVMHKLNTPLQTLMGGLEWLSSDSLSTLGRDEIARLALLSQQGAQRFIDAVADILHYLKTPLLARSGELVRVGQLVDLVAQIATQLGLTISIKTMEQIEDWALRLTRRGLTSLLWELLENAQKFHPQRAPTVQVTLAAKPPGMLLLSIMDDGVHLSPEQVARVWLPYYQAEKHFTGERPGMGLGLPMVATIVWEVGGECRFRNRTDGPGVIVELELPLAG
jgi:CheY-like chemotaxis protein/anti-sigma regulatory factor (Ser/Thr protein kinase)